MEIQLAELHDQNEIVSILNKVTLYLHKKGINQWSYPWNPVKIKEDIEKHFLYIIRADGRTVGTSGMRDIEKLGSIPLGLGSKYLAQIALLPEYQGKGIGAKVIEFASSSVKEAEVNLYLDCWAENNKLREFYSNNGFRHMGDFPEEDYFISIFEHK